MEKELEMAALIDSPITITVSPRSNETGSMTAKEAGFCTRRNESLTDFNGLVLAHQDMLYNQAYRMLGDHPAAADATQEAFSITYKKFHTYQGGSLACWLLRIVTNLCLDQILQGKRSHNFPLEPVDGYGEVIESPKWLADPVESPEEAVERGDVNAALQAGINRLPPEYRSILVLVDIQGLRYAEAAEVIGCPISTVKSRLARARSFMQVVLNEMI